MSTRGKIFIGILCLIAALALFFCFRSCMCKDQVYTYDKSNEYADSLMNAIALNNAEMYHFKKSALIQVKKADDLKKEAKKLPRISTFKESIKSKDVVHDSPSVINACDSLYKVALKGEVLFDSLSKVNDSLSLEIARVFEKQALNDSLNVAVQDTLQNENNELNKNNQVLAEENEKLRKNRLWWYAFGFGTGKAETYAEIAALRALSK